ncbi:FAD-binding oxidoreductase [Zhouia spongiae]|uniref:FAD-binding oxidoreductase n=1 Tax=Zhouia spongiae TaxID=2202721 RepID=A0ABY3YQT0_9FLAO|nr:FAD-binding oxidoreductase [Zhouia spongiae]UNZ00193.1 FAD-binding oxidoreductase [Zhouia spongiae]
MVDYIIVGLGLAGTAFAEQLLKHEKSFIVYDDTSQQSSLVAGALYNPVILKRFTKVWRAHEQLASVESFYPQLESKLNVKFDFKIPVYRRFASVEEQNLWFDAADKPLLEDFLSTTLIKNDNNNIDAPFGYGEVLSTGRVDTDILMTSYTAYLLREGFLKKERFNYEDLIIEADHVMYNNVKAKNIVFCEGFGLKSNPYFNYLPLNGTKGQLLTIHAPELKTDFVLKSSVFLIPTGNDFYRVGATYERHDKTNQITREAREELLAKMDTFIKCPYEVVDQKAGIRPTVTDRRPLVGKHPVYPNVYVLNGMGSRGVMIAPYASGQLYEAIELSQPIDDDMDILRFRKKYPAP